MEKGGTELLPADHKRQQGHRRNHKTNKHHRRHSHGHQHKYNSFQHPVPSEVPFSRAFLTSTFPTKTREQFTSRGQIATAPLLGNQMVASPVYQYARAERDGDRKEIKIAKVIELDTSPIPTISTTSGLLTTSSLQRTRNTTGIIKVLLV